MRPRFLFSDDRDPPVLEFSGITAGMWDQMTRDRQHQFKAAQKLAEKRRAEVRTRLEGLLR